MFKHATAAAAAVLFAFSAGSAGAAVQVLGTSMAASCSKAAFDNQSHLKALDVCNRSLEEEAMNGRDRAATYVNRGIVLMRRGDYPAAMRDFENAIQLEPALGETYANRGSLHIVEGRFQQAVNDFNRALELGLAQPERTYFNRAVAREWMDDAKGAYFDYQRAAQLNPKWPEPQEQMVRFTVIRR
jgi:tetratricopeptide (TPR) repeat protein